jgi:hypothetical protein
MRTRILLIAGIMGIAVISGIFKGLISHQAEAEKGEEEKPGDKEECSGAAV